MIELPLILNDRCTWLQMVLKSEQNVLSLLQLDVWSERRRKCFRPLIFPWFPLNPFSFLSVQMASLLLWASWYYYYYFGFLNGKIIVLTFRNEVSNNSSLSNGIHLLQKEVSVDSTGGHLRFGNLQFKCISDEVGLMDASSVKWSS